MVHTKRTAITLSIALGVLTSACATYPPYDQHPYYLSHPRCPARTAEFNLADAMCSAKPSVVAYFEALKREIYDTWTLPPNLLPNRKVRVTMRIDTTGAVECLSVDSDDARGLASSVISAIEQADPLPAIPSDATCLSYISIGATFSTQ